MSRIGKKPIAIPDKVEVKISGHAVDVKGPKGSLHHSFPNSINIKQENKTIVVTPVEVTPATKALWGTARTLISNMMVGVSKGFTKNLTFSGVGYKAATKGDVLTLNLGHSHPIDYQLPKGISAKVDKNNIEISGSDKELVGFVAAKVRSFREPEPYQGKGLRYSDEHIRRKAGKTGAKA